MFNWRNSVILYVYMYEPEVTVGLVMHWGPLVAYAVHCHRSVGVTKQDKCVET